MNLSPKNDTDKPETHSYQFFFPKIHPLYRFQSHYHTYKYGFLELNKLPGIIKQLGKDQRGRVFNCIHALVNESAEKGYVSFVDSEFAQLFWQVKKWMYENVYYKIDWGMHHEILKRVYEFYATNPFVADCDPCLLIALTSDKEMNDMGEIILGMRKLKVDHIQRWGIYEIVNWIRGRKIDIHNPLMRKELFNTCQ